MSTIFLQVGQCGNQVGSAFWKKTLKSEEVQIGHTFIHADRKPRCVMVDSEPKVINRVASSIKCRDGNAISGKRGRGTNWALGYYGLQNKGEEHIIETTMEKVRKEIELCDAYSGCVVMHSLSGGTGSGLGSKLIEMLRDQYPMNHLMSCTFAPHASGESPLQNYNALLTLSTLQRNTDCVILTHNDDVLARLQKSKESVSFTNINDNIAAALCGVFLPTDSLKPKSGISIGMEPWEMMRSICPMPGNKFVQLNHISRSKLSWESMVTQLLHSLKRHDVEGKHFSSIASLAVGRGEGSVAFPHAVKNSERKLRSAYGFVPWNPFPLDVWTGSSVGKLPSVTVASNHGSIVEYLDLVQQRSKVKHAAGAYLHWYWRYGASEETFSEAFEVIDELIEGYKSSLT